MMTRACLVAAAVLTAMNAGPASGADWTEEGREQAARCIACHGAEGLAPNPTFPRLAGQDAAYLEIQLRKFRTGERYHPLMTPVAESLSDQDIAHLARYYGTLRPQGESQ